jgi:hypothetical protein
MCQRGTMEDERPLHRSPGAKSRAVRVIYVACEGEATEPDSAGRPSPVALLTLPQLERHLFGAADVLRGRLTGLEYRDLQDALSQAVLG